MAQPNDNNSIQTEDQEQETLDFNKPDFLFQPGQHHQWRQQGPYLCCKSCEIEHAAWIGMEKIMAGLKEDGTPIIRLR